jgi:hypothetical protein
MKICIATPMYGGNCKGVYTESLINLLLVLSKAGHQVVYTKIYNESLITRARNSLVREFYLSKSDALLFIDADHGFNADDVLRMIDSGKDLIGAIYPMKNINWEDVRHAVLLNKENLADYSGFFSANLPIGLNTINLNEPTEVVNVATGMMFITKKVFDTMTPNCKTYAFSGNTGAMQPENQVIEFFTTEIDEDGVLLSEDYYFCKKWQELGGKVYAAPWVRISHAGDYDFQANFAKSMVLRSEVEAEIRKQRELDQNEETPTE